MSNQWDFVVETLEDSDCDDLDIDLIFESKDILGALKLKFDKILIKNDCSGGLLGRVLSTLKNRSLVIDK